MSVFMEVADNGNHGSSIEFSLLTAPTFPPTASEITVYNNASLKPLARLLPCKVCRQTAYSKLVAGRAQFW